MRSWQPDSGRTHMATTKTTKGRKASKATEPDAMAKTVKAKARKAPTENAKGMSALDAAAKVLAGADGPLNCKEMIDAMAAKGYWQSPGGKTPASTLFSAILRE